MESKERPGVSEDGGLEATLTRKHEWESTTKKASHRAWDKVYIVLGAGSLLFYKDQRNFKLQPKAFFRGENPVDVHGSSADVAADYTKKKHVFRLKLASGGEYLFQAKDDAEMNQWIQAIQDMSSGEGTAAGPSRAQTLLL